MAAFQGRARPQGPQSAHVEVRIAIAILVLLLTHTTILQSVYRLIRSEISTAHSGSSGSVGRYPEEGESFFLGARAQAVLA